ncbi:MAG: HlyD family efflux transporter periplasmic adaptor subunit [Nitrososphaeraceae archaeon]
MERLKVDQKEIEMLDVRSHEAKEVIGYVPHRIIRYGIGLITLVVIFIIFFSFFFRYPDIIKGSFYVQSINPPAFMLSPSKGKLEALLANESDSVKKGELLGIIESSTSIEAYYCLKSITKELSNQNYNIELPAINNLGSLQRVYSSLCRAHKDFLNFKKLNYSQKKIDLLTNQRIEMANQITLHKRQLKSANEALRLSREEFTRDSTLYNSGILTDAEYKNACKKLVSQKMNLTREELSVSNSLMNLNELDSRIIELQLNQTKDENLNLLALEQAFNELKGDIAQWEKMYCIISPIEGSVALSDVWDENQNVKIGQLIMTIIPFKRVQLVAKIIIPIERAGKVKVEQKVNLKFVDFPYQEYGIVYCKLYNISEVPDSSYVGTIYLDIPIVSNYGKKLEFKQNMQGTAEIITEDLSIAERMFFPLRTIMRKHVVKKP